MNRADADLSVINDYLLIQLFITQLEFINTITDYNVTVTEV